MSTWVTGHKVLLKNGTGKIVSTPWLNLFKEKHLADPTQTDFLTAEWLERNKSKASQLLADTFQNAKDEHGVLFTDVYSKMAEGTKTELGYIVSLLYFCVTKGGIPLESLEKEGFDSLVIVTVEQLCKKSGAPYLDYIGRLLDNPYAVDVKLTELKTRPSYFRSRIGVNHAVKILEQSPTGRLLEV